MILRDLEHAIRLHCRRPFQSAIAVVLVGSAIAFCISFFRLYDNLTLQLPGGFETPRELIGLGLAGDGSLDVRLSGRLRRAIAERSRTIDAAEAVMYIDDQSMGEAKAQTQRIGVVTEGFLSKLGVRIYLGSGFRPDGQERDVILDYGYWQRKFGGDRQVLGKQIEIQGSAFEVVGVADPGFKGTHRGQTASAWVPLKAFSASVWGAQPDVIADRFRMVSIGRLAPGRTVAMAQRELQSLTQELRSEYRDDLLGLQLVALEHLAPDPARHASAIRHVELLVLAATAVMLIASGNLGLFFLSRVPERQREMGIRLSLGATRARLARQLLTESSVLVTTGICLGVIAQYWLTEVLRRLPTFAGVDWQKGSPLDWPMAVYVATLGLLAAVLVGVAPAVNVLRRSLIERSQRFTARAGKTQRLVVSAQISIGGLALSIAGLFVQNALHNSAADVGYSAEGVQAVRVVRGDGDWPTDASLVPIYRQRIAAGLEATVQVESVGFGGAIPGVAPPATYLVRITDGSHPEVASQVTRVSASWFDTLGVRVMRGRLPTSIDENAVVVSARFADLAWATLDVIGKQIRVPVAFSPAGGAGSAFADLSVAAVVGDVQFGAPGDTISPTVFVTHPVPSDMGAYILLRGSLDARIIASSLNSLLAETTSAVRVASVSSLETRIDALAAPERARAALIGIAGGFAALLALLGFLGTVRFILGNAEWELALRSALGADRGELRKEMLARGFALGVPGLVPGFVFAPIALGYIAEHFGLRHGGLMLPVTICGAAFSMTMGLSVWFPATRAARVAPAEVLKAH